MNIILIYFSIKYKGNWDSIYKALEEKEKVSLEEINKTENWIKENNIKVVTILDMDYPNALKEAYKPPFVIWYKGDKKLLDKPILYTTGNNVDDYCKKRIIKHTPVYENKYILLSASFQGVDEAVVTAKNGPTIYVESKGLDKSTIKLEDMDLLVSEYPEGVEASKETYRERNRLIAALSQSLILYSSDKDGPMNHLVSSFLNLGKEIYCYPGMGDDKDGNSELIKQGATLITVPEDICK